MEKIDKGEQSASKHLASPGGDMSQTQVTEYEAELALLRQTISQQQGRISSLEKVIRQFLSHTAEVPDDILTSLQNIGFDQDLVVKEELVDENVDSVPQTSADTVDTGSGAPSTSSFSTQTWEIPDNNQSSAGAKKRKSRKSAIHKNTGDSGKSAAVCKEECVPETSSPGSSSPVKKRRKTDTKSDKARSEHTETTPETSCYISKSGRKCKKKVLADHEEEGTELDRAVEQIAAEDGEDSDADAEYEPNEDDKGHGEGHGEGQGHDEGLVIGSSVTDFSEQDRKEMTRAVPYPCLKRGCDVACTTERDMIEHLQRCHPEDRSRICGKCNRAFRTIKEKKAHSKGCVKSARTGPFICEICGRDDIKDYKYLKEHVRAHRRTEQLRKEREAGVVHKKYPLKANMSPCEFCGLMVAGARMMAHVATHVKPHKCADCGKSFTLENALHLHRAKHHGEEDTVNPACRYCGKTFLSQTQVNKHEKSVHTDEYTHKCEICGRQFKSEHLLKSHLTNMHGEKQWQCDQCTASFGLKNCLQRHIKFTHQNNVTVYCNMCKAKFSSYQDLRIHRQEVHVPHREFKFPCLLCDKGFFDFYKYRRHLGRIHKTDITVDQDKSMTLIPRPRNTIELTIEQTQ